jgi:hypothetical protein
MIVVSAVRRIVLTAEVLALFVEVMIEMRRLARQTGETDGTPAAVGSSGAPATFRASNGGLI